MGRDPLEIRKDINLAGRALTDAVDGLQRRGWLPFVTLGAALVVGLLLQRNRPIREVAERSRGAVDRALQVATTLAAIERFRERRRAA
ncbi:MAG TPA: hypothetical protein VIE36_26870 [Methylomirabilota bacterium]|jgi:hypothetical protein